LMKPGHVGCVRLLLKASDWLGTGKLPQHSTVILSNRNKFRFFRDGRRKKKKIKKVI
jgi:hypothetical protein